MSMINKINGITLEDFKIDVDRIVSGEDEFLKALKTRDGKNTVEQLNNLLSCFYNSTVLSSDTPKLPFVIKINTWNKNYSDDLAHENLKEEIKKRQSTVGKGDKTIYYTEVYQYYPSSSNFNITNDFKPGFCVYSIGCLDDEGQRRSTDFTEDEAWNFWGIILNYTKSKL